MNKVAKLLMVGAFSSVLSAVPVKAGTINFQTYFKAETVKIQSNHKGYIDVFDNEEKIFVAKRDVKYMYATTNLNLRKAPSVNSKVVKIVNIGTKLKRIGNGFCGWDIVKLDDGTKAFVWDEYLSENNPVINLGRFRITYYCNCEECSEGYGRLTSTGNICYSDYTIAVDPDVIPYGSIVYINGHKYVADDCGGGINGNEIDVYVDHHSLTEKNGVDYYDVYLKR